MCGDSRDPKTARWPTGRGTEGRKCAWPFWRPSQVSMEFTASAHAFIWQHVKRLLLRSWPLNQQLQKFW